MPAVLPPQVLCIFQQLSMMCQSFVSCSNTGAAVTLMSEDAWKKTFPQGKLDKWMGPALVSAGGTPCRFLVLLQ